MAASHGNPPLPGAIVPFRQTTPECSVLHCPFCIFAIPHDSTAEDVCGKMTLITDDTREQARDLLWRYVCSVKAADNVLTYLRSGEPLPAAANLETFIDSRASAAYNNLLARMVFPCASPSESVSERDDGVLSGAAAAASSGSRGTTRGTRRSGDEAEYPQWQFKGGKKKKQWQAYDKKTNQLLESAYQRGIGHLDFVIDEWKYTVSFCEWSQMSHEYGSVREVRRVEDAGCLAP